MWKSVTVLPTMSTENFRKFCRNQIQACFNNGIQAMRGGVNFVVQPVNQVCLHAQENTPL